MAFDRGCVSFRMLRLKSGVSREVVDRFAAMAAPPIDSLGRDPIQGWVAGDHLLDREITADRCILGPWLHLNLMRAERKIPEALLRAYCRLDEEAERRARQVDVLPRKVKSEIRERMVEQLQPQMPPTLTGTPMVLDFRNDLLLTGAMSDAQLDRFCPFFRETTGQMPVLLTADNLALLRRQVNSHDLAASVFSPDPTLDAEDEVSLGLDFMTWLWHSFERDGGVFHTGPGNEPCGFMLEGPLTFFHEGAGAHEALLRKGSPLLSREAGMAMVCGKKLKRAKFTLARGDRQWTATLDADFGIRGLKLPPCEQFDPFGRFQERMLAIETFHESLFALFDRFLDLRCSRDAWAETLEAIRQWVAHHAGV